MFKIIDRDTSVADILSQEEYRKIQSIVFVRSAQAGKTSDVLRVAEQFYKETVLIFVSDKNSALANQTNQRALSSGFTVIPYTEDMRLAKIMKESIGKKKIIHFMMEVNNLKRLEMVLDMSPLPVTLVIDEADKSRNTIDSKRKRKAKEEVLEVDDLEEEEEDVADVEDLPAITKMLLMCKNHVKENPLGRTIFVSATPMGILTAEKENWLVLYKQPYNNYVGVGLNHQANIHINGGIPVNDCPANSRWTGDDEDRNTNTWYPAISYSVQQFCKAVNREPSIKQIMLISLEQRNIQQELLALEVSRNVGLNRPDHDVAVVVFNATTKDSSETLADIIGKQKARKIIIIAGFCAARGVSFTDFSDKSNQFELIIQVHASKKSQPLNSCLQAMRISGPARRTVSKPSLICNLVAENDIRINFLETYRIVQEIASGNLLVRRGNLENKRKLTQNYNFRYLKQIKGTVNSGSNDLLVYESYDEADHLPLMYCPEEA